MTARTCPSCSRRWAQLIDADCPICAGTGTIPLGAAALHRYPDQVVSRAVEFALEAAARDAMLRQRMLPSDARRALVDTMSALRVAGVVGRSQPDDRGRRVHGTPADELKHQAIDVAEGSAPVVVEDVDPLRTPQDPLQFGADDRPMSEGGLPGFSAGGYVAWYARVADPLDPLTSSTRAMFNERLSGDRQAHGLKDAAVEAAQRKGRAGR